MKFKASNTPEIASFQKLVAFRLTENVFTGLKRMSRGLP
jgi:hypothetical protein